ncbi:transposase, MuDR, MULE transposase domain protein [Tanacetum coccineum]
MACSVPKSYDEIKAMVGKKIQENRGRQLAIMNLAHEFNDACTAKDDLRKAYEECRDIPLEQRALIDKFLKIESELDSEMHNSLLWQTTKLEKQIIVKTNENPQPIHHKWKKFMSFKPGILETPLYKSKPMISKHYNKDSEVKIGNTFDNQEALDLAVRLKAVEDGYQFLSKKTNPDSLERKNKRTITHIKTDEEGVFEMLFIALGASIRMFVNHLRPLLIIDTAHLKGQYKGTNLVAIGMDGNNQIVPIAFGICKGKTSPCWSWWISVLKECIGDNPNLLFISDRHPAIALAVCNEFPLAFHDVCCRHLMMNTALKNKKTKGLYWKICKAYTPKEFTYNMDILQAVQPDAYHKLIEAGPQRWSRAHCPLIRYNYMTSNSVDSVNACSVLNIKLPITMLTETYHEMLQKWYFEHQEVVANMKHEITDWVGDKVHKRKLKSVMWVVNGIDQNLYQVYDGRYNREVNLMSRSCECRTWQLSGIPYGHVIVVTRFLGLTKCVQFVGDWFKK